MPRGVLCRSDPAPPSLPIDARVAYTGRSPSHNTSSTGSVAASRVYLGVHWLSDIGAGITGGLLWVATTTVGYETFRLVEDGARLSALLNIGISLAAGIGAAAMGYAVGAGL